MVAEADATGTATVVLAYGPFGEVHRGYGSGATLPLADIRQPFRFTGQMRDAATGLSYHRARYYSAALGRFLSPDPSGYADGFNLYAYVGNDPVNLVDPGGMYAERAANWVDERYQVIQLHVDATKIATIKYAGYHVGNLNSNFEMQMFDRWAYGGGDYELSDNEFDDIIAESTPDKKDETSISLYGSEKYDAALGSETVLPNTQNPAMLIDKYDFDPKPWFERPIMAEIKTRAVNMLRPSASRDFYIRYGM